MSAGILLIGFKLSWGETFSELFSINGFTPVLKNSVADALASPDDDGPEIILVRQDDEGDRGYWQEMRRLSERMKSPLVIVSSASDPSFFFRGVEHGIYYYITIPCSRNFIVSRIREIIDSYRTGPIGAKPLTIEFDFHDRHYTFSADERHFSEFIYFILGNSAHQSRLLIDLLKKRTQVSGPRDDADILDDREYQAEGASSGFEKKYKMIIHYNFSADFYTTGPQEHGSSLWCVRRRGRRWFCSL